MTVDATFIGEALPNALMVPTVAIATQNGQLGVQMPDSEGNPDFQPVTVASPKRGKLKFCRVWKRVIGSFLELPPAP
jgi:HlyD family secretion protein